MEQQQQQRQRKKKHNFPCDALNLMWSEVRIRETLTVLAVPQFECLSVSTPSHKPVCVCSVYITNKKCIVTVWVIKWKRKAERKAKYPTEVILSIFIFLYLYLINERINWWMRTYLRCLLVNNITHKHISESRRIRRRRKKRYE